MKAPLSSIKSWALAVCLVLALLLMPDRGMAQNNAANHWRNTPANTWFLMSMDIGRLMRIMEASADLRELATRNNPDDPIARMWAMGKLGLVMPYPMVFGASAGTEGKGPKTLDANPALKDFIQAPPDFGMYFDLGNFPKEMIDEAMKEQNPSKTQQQLVRKMIGMVPPVSASMRFGQGSVTIDTTAYDKNVPANLEGKALPADLLNVVPANSIAAFKMCINKKAMGDHIQAQWNQIKGLIEEVAQEQAGIGFVELEAMIEAGLQESAGLTPDELMAIPKGDLVLALSGIGQGEFGEPAPSFLLGLSIADDPKLDKLLDKMEDQGLMDMLNGSGVKLVRKPGLLFLCSPDQERAIRRGRAAKPIAGARRQLLDANGISGFLGFDQIAKLARQFEAPKPVQDTLAALDTILFTGSLKQGKQAYRVSLNFKDKQTNGLQQLMELAIKINPELLDQRPRAGANIFDEPARRQERDALQQNR